MSVRTLARVVAALLFVGVVGVNVAGAGAQSVAPSLALSGGQLQPGERVWVTFDAWQARSAVLSVCGNRAARGSGDCDMVGSQGVRLRHRDETMVHDMSVTTPPTPCPCVIRAVGVETGEVAVAPIELVGHPVGPVEGPSEISQALSVRIDAVEQRDGVAGWLRSALGGRVGYAASVTVENLTTETWSNIDLAGSVGRSAEDQSASFSFEVPQLGPNGRWTGTAEVDLPPPAVGSYDWRATASGAGPTVTADAETRTVPWLLFLLVAVLVGDLTAIGVRALRRWRLRRDAQRLDDERGRDVTVRARGVGGTTPDYVEVPLKVDPSEGG